MESLQIGLGDEVFFVGLFKEHAGRKRNVPIVRVGNIAAMPEEPVTTQNWGDINAYLIEARSIGGISGSPVFVHIDQNILIPPGTALAAGGQRTASHRLLGLIHGHWGYQDSVIIEEDAGGLSLNMGIAIVIPFQEIVEVLHQPDFVSQQAALVKKIEASRNLPVED